jgi:hypothetical protein
MIQKYRYEYSEYHVTRYIETSDGKVTSVESFRRSSADLPSGTVVEKYVERPEYITKYF